LGNESKESFESGRHRSSRLSEGVRMERERERERERVLVEERKNGEEERVPVAAEPLYREGHQPHWRPTVLQGH
jgi:hypothetical protein